MEASATDGVQACTISFAAFYCDLEHELLPVTGGLRLCLAYNLVRQTQVMTAPVIIKVCLPTTEHARHSEFQSS